jgi:thiamine-monophosphate kinase
MPRRIASMGEFGLVDRIRTRHAGRPARGVVVGLGDDAFAARLSPGHLLVSTKDILIENIHFRRDWTSPFDLGYKAMASNLSDLAAMGRCRPRYGLIGLGLPGDITVDYVDKLYTGMNKIARRSGLAIIGGDTTASQKDIVISITLIGESKKSDLVTRSGAQPGDTIYATGTLGDSGGGLYLLQKGTHAGKGFIAELLRRHRLPEPRLALAARLTATRRLTAMIDSSDGLAASLHFICASSGVGARVDLEKVPISRALRQLAAAYAEVDPVTLALTGGEDYELVFTARRSAALERIPGITAIGTITPGRQVNYHYHGTPKKIATSGYQHFAS